MQSGRDCVYAVYQKGSFSKAAESLNMTQPALSIAVQKVESEVGMPLFDRGQKPVRLTEAGRIYIDYIRQRTVLEHGLRSRLTDLTSMRTGTLRIGATSYILSRVLPKVLFMYKKRYPGVSLGIVEAGSFELKEMLRDQEVDVIFLSRIDKRSPFSARPAFRDRLVLAVPEDFSVNDELSPYALTGRDIAEGRHIEAGCPAVDLRLLRDTPFVLLENKYDLRKRAEGIFAAAGIAPPVCLETAQLMTAQVLSRAGMGAVFVPDLAVDPCGAHSGMCFYKLDSPLAVRDMNFVTNDRSYFSAAMQHFIDVFETEAGRFHSSDFGFRNADPRPSL